MGIVKTGEGILFTLGTLLVALILLYGVASLLVKFSPQPISGWLGQIVARSTPSGWNLGSSGMARQ